VSLAVGEHITAELGWEDWKFIFGTAVLAAAA
jgi:hypothetical protein